MKKILLALLLTSQFIYGQKSKIETEFSDCQHLFNEKEYKICVNNTLKLIPTINDTLSLMYGQSLILVGDCYLRLNELSNAELYYQKVLHTSLKDSTETNDFVEPFANYKNNACKGLAYVYEYKKDWKTSLYWLNQTKVYPHYCYASSHKLEDAVDVLEWYIFLYKKMDKYDDAMYEGLNFILNNPLLGNYDSYYKRVNQYFLGIIYDGYNKTDFINKLNNSTNNIVMTQKDSLITATLKLYGKEISMQAYKNQKDIINKDSNPFNTVYEIKPKNSEYFKDKIQKQLFYEILQTVNAKELTKKDDLIYKNDTLYSGEFTEYFGNGNFQTKGSIKEGKLDGNYISYYKNGIKKESGIFIQGNYNGKWITYYDNGAIESEGEYVLNKKNGNWIYWYESGRKNMPVTFNNGSLNSATINATSDTDIPKQKKAEIEYKDDIENGKISIWYENGQIFRQGEYENGKRIGKWFEWNEKGKKTKNAEYKNGELISGDNFEK